MKRRFAAAAIILFALLSGCLSSGSPEGDDGQAIIVGYFKPEAFMELQSVNIQRRGTARFFLGESLDVIVLPSGYFYVNGVEPGAYVLMSVSEASSITHQRARTFTVSYLPDAKYAWAWDIAPESVCYMGSYNLSSFPIPFSGSTVNHINPHREINEDKVIEKILPRVQLARWRRLLERELEG